MFIFVNLIDSITYLLTILHKCLDTSMTKFGVANKQEIDNDIYLHLKTRKNFLKTLYQQPKILSSEPALFTAPRTPSTLGPGSGARGTDSFHFPERFGTSTIGSGSEALLKSHYRCDLKFHQQKSLNFQI